MTKRMQALISLLVSCISFGGLAGCAPRSTPPAVQPTPTVAPGWERLINEEQCGYVIDFPSEMDSVGQGPYSWILSFTSTEPSGPVPNFIYISVIPVDFQNDEPGVIYNYDPVETRTLLNLQVGESRSLRDDPLLSDWFSYTRRPDTALGSETAQTYENDQPWEFPPGTKEIRYYVQAKDCTYLIGGYMSTVGSGQVGAIDEERFDQIMDTFRPVP